MNPQAIISAAVDYAAAYSLWKEVRETQRGPIVETSEQSAKDKHNYLISLCKEYMRGDGFDAKSE